MEDLLKRALGPGVRLVKNFPDDLPMISIDSNQLELALLNLAVNARDAMPLGGDVVVTAAEASAKTGDLPRGLTPRDYVRISVRDNGVGMDAATLARATEPFFTTKGPGKGTGLGLSMVQGLAAQSGGLLHISSEPGFGTSIGLFLPCAVGHLEAKASTAAVSSQVLTQRRRTVLVVDDDPLVCTGTAAMLEDLGHVVIEASTGWEALDTLRANGHIDLVITDHAMPGMTGTELARQIRGTHPSLAIVLATGYAEIPHGEGQELALPRLSKPYGQEELALAVAKACEAALN
jgi:CheY-like chemotaxis protein